MHPLEVCIFLSLAGTVTSWTDRLISSRCLSERELVNVANRTCFEDAFNYTFAGSCPPGFHSEITYSCPPRPNSDPRFEFLGPVFDEYQHDLRSWVLKNMAIELTSVPQLNGTNFDPSNSHYSPPPDSNSIISNFKARNSLQIYETVESQLSRIESSIRGYEDLEQIKKPATHPNTTFVSMQMNLRMLKIRISDGGRTDAIVKTIGRLLRGESVDEDEFLKEHSLDKFLAVNRDSRFPELEQDLRELYRRLMSSKTPGILSKYLNYMGQPDEHKRLLAQYKEIFQKGKISFKYLDSTNKDFLISSHQEPSTFWTDRLVAHKSPNRDSQNGCLSPQLLLELANRRCQKYPETREYRVENTSELHPEMIKMTLGKPCDSKKTTFKEVSLECRFPQSSIRFPDPSIERHFFHRYFLTLLQEYAGAVKEKKPREIFERSEIGRFVSFASMSLDSFDPMNHIYGIGTPTDNSFEDDDALAGSREYAQTWAKGGMRYSFMSSRTKILLQWALRLLWGEPISADDLKEFDVESLRLLYAKEQRSEVAAYDDKRELWTRLGEYYVEYAKEHTIAVGRKHLDFLAGQESHLKMAELYRKIFTFGRVDTSYLD